MATAGRDELSDFDGVIVAVSHAEFSELSPTELAKVVRRKPAPLLDLKWLFERRDAEAAGFEYWPTLTQLRSWARRPYPTNLRPPHLIDTTGAVVVPTR